MIDEKTKQAILDNTDIVAVVSRFVKLEKKGRDFAGLCPFHQEETPSFMVSPEKKICKCMGCGVGGNAITFLAKIEGINYDKAALKLAEPLGIKINLKQFEKYPESDYRLININNIAKDFYVNVLNNTQGGLDAKKYLTERGIDEEIIKRFQIGLAPVEADLLYKTLRDKEFTEVQMLSLGLIHSSDKGYFDAFIKRIMFPVIDEENNTLGFSGRIYNNEETAKYINSQEGPIFKKGAILYNLNNAFAEIKKKKRVILYEGFFDCIASFNAELKEAVCSMGTALTENQANLIKKLAPEVIICYDGDNAGIKATVKAIEILLKTNLLVRAVKMPKGLDPDDFVKEQGGLAFLDYFNSNLRESHDYLYNYYLEKTNLSDIYQAEIFKEEVFKIIKSLPATIKERYLNRLAADLNLNLFSVEKDFLETTKAKIKEVPKKKISDIPEGDEWAERVLIRHMLNNRDQAIFIEERLGNHLINEITFAIRTKIDIYYKKYDRMDCKLLLADFTIEQADYFKKYLNIHHGNFLTKERDDCLLKIEDISKKKQRKKFLAELALITDYEEKLALIKLKGETI